MAKSRLDKCPECGKVMETLPDGTWAECPECGKRGCEDCMPAGRGCLCPECEEAEERDE